MNNSGRDIGERYRHINDRLKRRFVYRVGEGRGFCADQVDILKVSMACLGMDIQFSLGENKDPKGYAVWRGWEDYFEPTFPMVRGALLTALNRSHFPFGRWPVMRGTSRMILKAVYGNDFFMCDYFPRVVDTDAVERRLGIEGEYWSVVTQYIDALWSYRDDVRQEIQRYKGEVSSIRDKRYVALHVRRGDKIENGKRLDVGAYLEKIEVHGLGGVPIYLATDDEKVYDELRAVLGENHSITFWRAGRSGYCQEKFNSNDCTDRWKKTVFFLFELEMMKNAYAFVGAAPSNVFFWVRYLRGNERVLDASVSS